MSEKPNNAGLKAALEYGPIAIFFAAYLLMKNHTFTIFGQDYTGFIAATALFIPILAASTYFLWRLTGHISKMQIMTLVLVVVFGGLSIWFNDERFFKMKPTIIYLIFAGLLGFGLLRGTSYLEAVMDQALPLKTEGWMMLTKRLMLFFLALALANEVIWRTMSTGTWVSFKTFGMPLGIFAFFMAQAKLLAQFSTEDANTEDDKTTGG